MVNPKYNQYLSKIFSGPVIKDLASKGESDFIRIVVNKSGFTERLMNQISWGQFFETLYRYLLDNYRSEYVYKNAIANKILLGRHSINTSNLISEFRVHKSKADIVILNGTSSVYEIKTAYDKLDRLEDQIQSYRKIFDLISIVTESSHIEKLQSIIDEKIGIFLLTDHYTISKIREPESNKKYIDPKCIIESLRKNEYLSIIKKEFGTIPDVPNTKIYSESKKFFCKLSPEIAHDRMVQELNKRSCSNSFKEFILKLPDALKSACFSICLNKSQMDRFSTLLENRFFPI